MAAESKRCRHHLANLAEVYITRIGWLRDVEVRIEWTESRPAPQFEFRCDKYYLRAYHGEKIVEHEMTPYKSLGAAKRGAKGFLAALRATTDRASSQQRMAS